MNPDSPSKRRAVWSRVFAWVGAVLLGYMLVPFFFGMDAVEEAGRRFPTAGSVDSVPLPPAVLRGTEAVYEAGFPDPFALPSALFASAADPPGRQRAPPARPPPPPLRLGGVVEDTALLHDEGGSTYVLRVGERAGPVEILSVLDDHIVVRFEANTYTLSLGR